MKRRLLFASLAIAGLAGCGSRYLALRNELSPPLSSLIVATRTGDRANAATFLAQFNTAAERVLPQIEHDPSPPANALHSVIVNTREAAARGDVATLEAQRRELLAIQ